jgi:FtsZ-binding cell division protein ZapB
MERREIIASLRDKTLQLIEDNGRLRQEYDALSTERDSLKAENRDLKLATATLEKRVSLLELSNGLAGGGVDTKQAQARINQLMREIDRCIALINR